MKKRFLLLLICILTFSLCIFSACSEQDPDKGNEGDNTTNNGGFEDGGSTPSGDDQNDDQSDDQNNGQTTPGGDSGNYGGGESQPLETYYVTFKVDGETYKTCEFTTKDNSIIEPSVPFKQCYFGKWEDYSLSEENITVNAIYTLAHSDLTHVKSSESQCNKNGNKEYMVCRQC